MKINGSCLCKAVQFQLETSTLGIYQCHCSECRKITGSMANSSCLVPADHFTWLSGSSEVQSYIHSSGYRSDFCPHCGSPVPNEFSTHPYYWVPAGALENTSIPRVKAHLCISSKADWELLPREGEQYAGVPQLDELLRVLARG